MLCLRPACCARWQQQQQDSSNGVDRAQLLPSQPWHPSSSSTGSSARVAVASAAVTVEVGMVGHAGRHSGALGTVHFPACEFFIRGGWLPVGVTHCTHCTQAPDFFLHSPPPHVQSEELHRLTTLPKRMLPVRMNLFKRLVIAASKLRSPTKPAVAAAAALPITADATLSSTSESELSDAEPEASPVTSLPVASQQQAPPVQPTVRGWGHKFYFCFC